MPEYAEMENYRKLLSEHLINKPITSVIVNREKSVNLDPELFVNELIGYKVIFVERRAKYLIFHLNNGRRLLLHLMLGGFLFYGREEDAPNRSKQVEIAFGEMKLFFMGLRLGFLHLLSAKEVEKELESIGPEPFDRRLDKDAFVQRLKGRKGALKNLLVNQQFIAGIGNCYADEIAFAAGLLPAIKVQDLTDEQMGNLYDQMKVVLREAYEAGGYMEVPFMAGDTHTGGGIPLLKVYDREGEPCPKCSTPIKKSELSSRKVFFCPNCQK